MKSSLSVTLLDVAKDACVSSKTVSRVLNLEPNVRPATRDKVMESVRRLGYRPNLAARSLASSKSYTIAHLHANPDQDYIARANAGIHKVCREHNYLLFMEPLEDYEVDLRSRLLTFLNTSRVDGIILTPPLTDHQPLLDLLKEREVSVVAISPERSGTHVASVAIDEREAAIVMTRYLISLGHQRIGFIAGPPQHGAAAARGQGFVDAIRDSGLDFAHCPQLEGDFSLRSGAEMATQILSGPSRPTAIFAANDAMAVGAMTSAFKLGLSVPEDISIAGFDASHIGSIVWPPLSTIRQPIGRMAQLAAQWLVSGDVAKSDVPLRQIFDFELVDRASTEPLG